MQERNLKEMINNNIILMDGAMGTYYASKQKSTATACERANINSPEVIEEIHKEYLQAGAKIIRTNTFMANPVDLECDFDEIKTIIEAGYDIAKKAVKDYNALIACSIGPITESSDTSEDEIITIYYKIIDVFLAKGADLFLFETFSETKYISKLVSYIYEKNNKAEIFVGLSVDQYGYSVKGLSVKRIIDELSHIEGLTAYGLNCGVGAGHMKQLLKTIDYTNKNILALPNAGYPEVILDRTQYMDNAEYFADTMDSICKLGVKIIGGCCGTTPKHIKLMNEKLEHLDDVNKAPKFYNKQSKTVEDKKINHFYEKLTNGEFVIAVEIDPPFSYNTSRLMEAAHILKANGVDIITIADSPMGKVRLDSLMMSVKIHHEVGIDVMPHVCCRDKNAIALKSLISAAYVEGIRNFLLVTGDPLPDESRSEIKSVFHMNSVKLMSLVNEMNKDIENDDYFVYGGALNPKVPNIDRVVERVIKKREAGAKYLLTQPVFTKKEIENLKYIKEKTGIKILGGILPLVSYKNARFIDNEFAGMNIPDEVINRFNPDMSREEAEEVGITCAVEIATSMKNVVDGFYFMTPFNRATMIAKILKKLIPII